MKPEAIRSPRVLFLMAAAILVAVGAWGIFSALRFIQDSRWVLQTATVMRHLDDVATLERRAVAAQRGYLLTNEDELREEFWEVKARVHLQVAELIGAVEDRDAVARARELQPMLERRMSLAARTLGIFERDGLDAAKAFIAGNGSRELDKQIRAQLDSIRDRELGLLAARRAALDRSANIWLLASALGIPLSLAMLALVNRLLVRENAERRRMAEESRASAHGYRRLSNDMSSLSRFAGMLQSCGSFEELLAITAQGFSILAPGVAGTVYLLRASRDHAEIAAQWGSHAAPGVEHPALGDCWSVRRNRPYTCPDVRAGIACAHVRVPGEGTAATACLPLSAQGTLMGWIYLSRGGSGPIEEYEVVLQAAEQMSLALANLRLQQDLRNQSIRDPLTGIYNRRYLEESLAREISRCARRQLPLVVLMFDIDHFKAFNDTHGHPGGDALLAAFGRLLQSQCRPEDIPCRFGGEEFTLILPEASLELGEARARAILAATAQMVVPHQGVSLGRVTTSIGVAVLPLHGSTATALIAAADKALYRAKQEGRNRACVADGQCDQAN